MGIRGCVVPRKRTELPSRGTLSVTCVVILTLGLVACVLKQIPVAYAECPGACSGHGLCGQYDACVCFKGYMGGECSQRVCQFGLAHVDIPKGDLDSSDEITDLNTHIVVFSPFYTAGTTEQYPNMHSSDGTVLSNTAHEYAECSNKGDCNRDDGECECLDGYEGSACQRAACPVKDEIYCSGHGICNTAREIAAADHNNVYELWDADITMGCVCDEGYSGPSCEERRCKHGFDPMFQDPEGSQRFTNISYVLYTRNPLAEITGNYSLEFHDIHEKRWLTSPIDYDASCLDVIDALESLPNDVIPAKSVRCTKWGDYNNIPATDEPIHFDGSSEYYGIKYTIAFPGNPGLLKPLKINKYLDGKRPTLFSSEMNKTTFHSFVYPNGFLGENNEYWVEKCIGVELSLRHQPSVMDGLYAVSEYSYIGDLTSMEMRLLQRCLGDADGVPAASSGGTGRIEGVDYNWDHGDIYNPHIIRLVENTDPENVVSDLCNRATDEYLLHTNDTISSNSNPPTDGGRSGNEGRACSFKAPNAGFYAALYYDSALKIFRLMNRPAIDYSSSTKFAVWTTTGHAQMVSDEADIYTKGESPDDMYSNTLYSINSTSFFSANAYNGLISCEHNAESKNGAFTCIEKDDNVFFLDTERPDRNPQYMNIYKVVKAYVEPNSQRQIANSTRNRIELNYAINSNFYNPHGEFSVRAYKFIPPKDGGYPYAAECSNRGLCDEELGYCECFDQFTGDACNTLNIFSQMQDDGTMPSNAITRGI